MVALHEPSQVILCWADPQQSHVKDLVYADSNQMNDGASDVRLRPVCPYKPQNQIFRPKDYIICDIITEGADTLDDSDGFVKVPITVENLRTGTVTQAWLTHVASTTYSVTFAGDKTYAAGERQNWFKFQIPDGINLTLGHTDRFNSRLYVVPFDDTA